MTITNFVKLNSYLPTPEVVRFNAIIQTLSLRNQIRPANQIVALSAFTITPENERLLKYLQMNNVIRGFKAIEFANEYRLIDNECDLDELEAALADYRALNDEARDEAIKDWKPYVESAPSRLVLRRYPLSNNSLYPTGVSAVMGIDGADGPGHNTDDPADDPVSPVTPPALVAHTTQAGGNLLFFMLVWECIFFLLEQSQADKPSDLDRSKKPRQ